MIGLIFNMLLADADISKSKGLSPWIHVSVVRVADSG